MGLLTNAINRLRGFGNAEHRGTDIRNVPYWLSRHISMPKSKVNVSEKTALGLPSVYRAVNILSTTIATLPLDVLKGGQAGHNIDVEHRLQYLLHTEANPEMGAMVWRQLMQASRELWGNGYSLIVRDEFTSYPRELIFIEPWKVEPFKTKDGAVYYRVHGLKFAIPSQDMVHIRTMSYDPLKGLSPIRVARESLGVAIAAEEYGARFFGQGGNMSGTLEFPQEMTPEQFAAAKKLLADEMGGPDNQHRVIPVPLGGKYNRIGIPPDDAQFIQTKKYGAEDVSRIFGLPPHMLSLLDRATHSNIEHSSMEFVRDSLRPRLVEIENELFRKLFTEEEKRTGSRRPKFNVNGLLRGDIKTRTSFYQVMLTTGSMTRNEVRELENMAPIEGGDEALVLLNQIPLADMGKYSEKITGDGQQ